MSKCPVKLYFPDRPAARARAALRALCIDTTDNATERMAALAEITEMTDDQAAREIDIWRRGASTMPARRTIIERYGFTVLPS